MASALAWAAEMCAGVQLHRRPPQRSPQAGLFNLKRYRIVFTKQSLRTFSRFFFVEIPRTVQYTRGLLFELWHSTPRDKSPRMSHRVDRPPTENGGGNPYRGGIVPHEADECERSLAGRVKSLGSHGTCFPLPPQVPTRRRTGWQSPKAGRLTGEFPKP